MGERWEGDFASDPIPPETKALLSREPGAARWASHGISGGGGHTRACGVLGIVPRCPPAWTWQAAAARIAAASASCPGTKVLFSI